MSYSVEALKGERVDRSESVSLEVMRSCFYVCFLIVSTRRRSFEAIQFFVLVYCDNSAFCMIVINIVFVFRSRDCY